MKKHLFVTLFLMGCISSPSATNTSDGGMDAGRDGEQNHDTNQDGVEDVERFDTNGNPDAVLDQNDADMQDNPIMSVEFFEVTIPNGVNSGQIPDVAPNSILFGSLHSTSDNYADADLRFEYPQNEVVRNSNNGSAEFSVFIVEFDANYMTVNKSNRTFSPLSGAANADFFLFDFDVLDEIPSEEWVVWDNSELMASSTRNGSTQQVSFGGLAPQPNVRQLSLTIGNGELETSANLSESPTTSSLFYSVRHIPGALLSNLSSGVVSCGFQTGNVVCERFDDAGQIEIEIAIVDWVSIETVHEAVVWNNNETIVNLPQARAWFSGLQGPYGRAASTQTFGKQSQFRIVPADESFDAVRLEGVGTAKVYLQGFL